MYSWRDRETIMDLLEALSGNRVNYSANLLGGVKFDIDRRSRRTRIRRGMDFLEPRTHHYLKIVTTDESFLGRTRGVGSIRHGAGGRSWAWWAPRRGPPASRGTSAWTPRTPRYASSPSRPVLDDGRRPGSPVRRADQGALRDLPRHPRDPGRAARRAT